MRGLAARASGRASEVYREQGHMNWTEHMGTPIKDIGNYAIYRPKIDRYVFSGSEVLPNFGGKNKGNA